MSKINTGPYKVLGFGSPERVIEELNELQQAGKIRGVVSMSSVLVNGSEKISILIRENYNHANNFVT